MTDSYRAKFRGGPYDGQRLSIDGDEIKGLIILQGRNEGCYVLDRDYDGPHPRYNWIEMQQPVEGVYERGGEVME